MVIISTKENYKYLCWGTASQPAWNGLEAEPTVQKILW